MPYFGWMPFTPLLSYNNDPLQLVSAIARWADQTDSITNKKQYCIIPTDYFYETLADGHTYRFRIADKNHYRTQSFTKTHYTVIADEIWSKSVAFNSDNSKGNDYSVSDLRKAYQTEILNQFNADQQASMAVAPVSSYKQDGTAVQIDDKIYPMSNFEMSGQKAYSNEKKSCLVVQNHLIGILTTCIASQKIRAKNPAGRKVRHEHLRQHYGRGR